MNDALAWARWWAFPWLTAHADWGRFSPETLYRSHHVSASAMLGISPCLAPPLSTTVLRLTQVSEQALDRALTLVDYISHNTAASFLPEDEQLWCRRFSKALPPNTLPLYDDAALHLLRLWVEPATWQRLRLRFARQRVLDLEKNERFFHDTHIRLDTLWQAVVWRITTLPTNGAPIDSNSLDTDDVMPSKT
ncbi:type III secretion protein [Pseudomonas tolaasii]|uniref:type III secretion protein n=1 Tax=Pseudomonas tolaasii TaxID=29442 RepID=UPI00210E26C2|nr:type III secretion protein [Pseudomonas tolaasii]